MTGGRRNPDPLNVNRGETWEERRDRLVDEYMDAIDRLEAELEKFPPLVRHLLAWKYKPKARSRWRRFLDRVRREYRRIRRERDFPSARVMQRDWTGDRD